MSFNGVCNDYLRSNQSNLMYLERASDSIAFLISVLGLILLMRHSLIIDRL